MPIRVIKYFKCQLQDLTQNRYLMKTSVTLRMDMIESNEKYNLNWLKIRKIFSWHKRSCGEDGHQQGSKTQKCHPGSKFSNSP